MLKLFFTTLLLLACSNTKQVVEQSFKNTINQPDSLNTAIIVPAETTTQQNQIAIVETPNKILEGDTTLNNDINHSDFDYLLQKYVTETGHVNYKNFKTDQKHLANYINILLK